MAKAELNKKLPRISAASTGGKIWRLGDYKDKNVVLYFYPKDATPGCTLEGHEFSRLKGQFAKLNTEVFGVSRDSLASHEKFKSKQCYTVDLLSDEEEELCALFDVVKDKNMYGKKVRGIVRSTFLIDGSGRLIKEWRGVKAEGHAGEVLAYIKSLEA